MLSYMLPVEEKSQSSRNLSLNLNLQNTPQSHSSTEQHDHEDFTDENTKLLNLERQDYVPIKLNGNGNLLNTGGMKTNYNMNITNNNLCNSNLINSNIDHNVSIIKKSDSTLTRDGVETESLINENSVNNNEEQNSGSDKKIVKMSKLGSKNVTLKRVSFGSSKGSMVETLIFETPTPLPEHAEREFFPSVPSGTGTQENFLNDSGIELQEELERSKVRVTFFQSNRPQQISPPSNDNHFYFGDNYFNNNSLIDSFLQNSSLSETDSCKMTAVLPPDYARQISTDSGWDNPFRPDGDLSREADEIVNLIKGGKPITPTGDQALLNGSHMNGNHESNGLTVVDGATKLEVSPLLNHSNGTKSPQKGSANGESTKDQPQVSNQTVPGPQSASCVVIDEKKKKGSKCCVIQ